MNCFRLLQGTTGNPKGATLTHHNILNNARFVGLRMNYHKKVPAFFNCDSQIVYPNTTSWKKVLTLCLSFNTILILSSSIMVLLF